MLTVLLLILMLSLQGWHPLGCLEEERIALLHLKHSLNYPNGTSLPTWRIAHANCCDWESITCNSSTSRVTELDLDSVRNQELGDWYLNASLFLPFQQLNVLYLSFNRIAGWVEKKGRYELHKLSNLEILVLDYNSFNNSILSLVEGLPSLKSLYLSYNRLEGLIDLKESLTNLEDLGLSGNNITKLVASRGPSSLRNLYLDNITTYGSSFQLLQSLGAFPNLTTLDLGDNDFRGRKLEFQNLSSLKELYLDSCSLDEHSFQSFGALPSLEQLSLQNLNGIVPFIGAFPNLTALYLGGNDFRGRVLDEKLQNLSSLESLYLEGCSLDEHSLQSFGALPSLKNLSLQELNGTVPYRGFLDLKNLEYLDLSYNTLNNSIFQTIGPMTSLKTLTLHSCNFNGQLPTTQGFLDLKNLEYLDLSSNTLNNSIFQTIGTMTSLKTLTLHSCNFNGQLPTTQGFLDFKNLEYLDLSYSTLDNSIFQVIGTMTSLKTLSLRSCNLNGQLPTTQGLCDLNHLQELNMYDNDLSGFLPLCLANLTCLQQLDLSSNHLKIPMSLSPLYNLSKLKYFDGSQNDIYAKEDDHNLRPKFQLKSLYLSGIGQGGAFPKFLYHQFSLQSLILTNIKMKGGFPNWLIENNTYLQYLYLDNCSLSGPFLLPKNSHMNLSFLSISMNYFQGQIPSEIGAHLPRLEFLSMSDNGVNGSIPSSLGNISSLRVLDLSNNALTGRILLNNSLQGQIPIWIWDMSSLEFLDLSGNDFFGPLPPTIGTSSNLRYIYLSRNKLQGPITMTFNGSSQILALDLSHNNLTGRIPEWIGGLSNLIFLLLSYNNL